MKWNYYSEWDPFAAAWLRELIKDGLIPDGEIDTRSICDVRPSDLGGFAQCHFFAGIGVWPLALRCAGWADDRPIWTGSCPCQPFSGAGKGGGFDDERHLWPAFFHLIGERNPPVIAGEQVASKDGLAWLDLVQTDMEGASYAFGAADTCAAGFGAPHIRQRLYWMAHAHNAGSQGWRQPGRECAAERAAGPGGLAHGLADTAKPGRSAQPQRHGGTDGRPAPQPGRLCDAGTPGHSPGPANGLWRNADWLGCRDGKFRPVEPGTFPLAHGRAFRNRVAELRGAGNALNLAQAVGFIEAAMESLPC